jgi:uncharacterized protein (TIGR02246 family)
MHTRWLSGVLLVATAVLRLEPAASAEAPDLRAELDAIEQSLVKAWLDRDEKAVDRILADDWSVIDLAGRVLTKAEVMREGFSSGERKIESGAIDEVRVRPLGEVAVVTGRSVLTGSYRGERMTVTQRFTDVFARRNGRWVIVASQGTRVAP